ncbi:MAG: DUF2809 domain-containing protein [Kofleriaceae bacterium]
MRKRFVAMAGLAIAIGIFVLIYRGPGRSIVRGNVGDGAAAMLAYALLSLGWRARIRTRAITAFAIACAVELGQTMWHAKSFAAELTIGSTFDPWDILAYAIGIAVAVLIDETAGPDACLGSDARTIAAGPRRNR